MRSWLPLVVAPVVALVTALPAQRGKDMRDVVVTKRGQEIRGRVVQRFDPDTVLISQGGKRVRVPVATVQSITTVTDHLREFFGHREKAKNILEREWLLVEWAQSKGLESMARLQATHVVLLDDGHEKAHLFLGHRQRGSQWLWPRGSVWKSRLDYEQDTAKWGKAKVVEGEHFQVRTNADTRYAIDAVFDLERLYVFWVDTFGKALRPREVLEPMNFNIWAARDEFPPFTTRRYPYYYPQPHGDDAYSFLSAEAGRADLLFQLGIEQLIYNSLLDGASAVLTPKDRVAAWVEIGLGQWVESQMVGAPGRAQPSRPTLDRGHGHAVLQQRPYGLQNMIGLRYARFHDPTTDTPLHWAHAASFVAWLMDDEKSTPTRAAFLRYIDAVYNEQRGNSSSLLDKTLGTKLEKLEAPWIAWLERKIGLRATRRRR